MFERRLALCSLGCKFAHGRCELRPGSAPKIGRPSKKETKDIPRKQQEDKDSASIKAAQIIQLRHSLHSQAALKLLMDSASRAPSKKAQEQTWRQIAAWNLVRPKPIQIKLQPGGVEMGDVVVLLRFK